MEKKSLSEQLRLMADDIQIGGDTNFKAFSILASGNLTDDQKKDIKRMLGRANRLLRDLGEFWDRHPELDWDETYEKIDW
jgi:hypothetical protein